jgi:hypothetical protein
VPDAPLTRSTGVHQHIRAGQYLYEDFPGAAPQRVDVTYIDGHPVARFVDVEPGDEGLELDPRDMAGEFTPTRG